MTKKQRHNEILKIIKNKSVSTQAELTDELIKCGFDVTQATVSRDIKELKLIKTADSLNRYYYSHTSSKPASVINANQLAIFTRSVVSIENAINQIVVKTFSGMAQAAASAIDAMNIPSLLGTIAGDDTILCITKSEQDACEIAQYLKNTGEL